MPRSTDSQKGRQQLQTQLENYKATRDRCREPQRSIFAALVVQIERELAKRAPAPVDLHSAKPEGSAA